MMVPKKAFLKYNDLLYHLLKMILCLTRHMHILQALLVFEILPYINEFSFLKHTRDFVGQYSIIITRLISSRLHDLFHIFL